MKNIVMSIVTVSAVVALTFGATSAYFNDTETSTGNTFTAGTIDLLVDGQNDPNVVTITRTNMQPQPAYTYQGYNQQFVLKNNGSLPGTVSWTVKNIENFENGCTEPEVGDTTCTTANNQGELGQYTWIQWSRNQAPWGNIGSQFNPLNTAEGVSVTGPVLAAGETLNAYMWLDFPARVDNMENIAQSDSLKFDIEFKLVQQP